MKILQRVKIKELLATAQAGDQVCAKGWVRTKRVSKNVVFITLNDGSTLHNLQIVANPDQLSEAVLQATAPGSSLAVEGTVASSQGQAQRIELQASTLTVLGTAGDYPLQPKKHSFEFLREIAHLRFRTNTFGAVFRIRHALSFAIHRFFHERGFVYLNTPIITGADAEGAGEMFKVTTLDVDHLPRQEDGSIDFLQDFFGRPTSLTVSGQLAAEAAALGLAEVYTFGPTFRAENSNTTRHLAEFWMVEPEMAFYDLKENAALAESFLKYLVQFVLDNCPDDLDFLHERALKAQSQKKHDESFMPLIERLSSIIATPFEYVTYTEAIEILKVSKPNKKGRFTYSVQDWGMDLQSEHERYLSEKHFQKPVVVTDYPKQGKAFYMRQNEDGKTVAAMDILFPGIGEMVGGSQREERLDRLVDAMEQLQMEDEALQWYLDTRRFGTVPHSGFGLGFERLVQFVTGMENIRDVIPFPRTPGHAAC
ncbi:MAG: asparagine--tRNA ligase [Bacteroidota bacterium]